MARNALPDEYMLPAELAKRKGLSVEKMTEELRRDYYRERTQKLYPYAEVFHNGETGGWQYRIHRKRFDRWDSGEDMGADQLISLIVAMMKGA